MVSRCSTRCTAARNTGCALGVRGPLRLVVDLSELQDLDAINLGTLAAACQLGDDHQVAVFLDHCCPPSPSA
jgi:anti-anti-sigma regulatory factor